MQERQRIGARIEPHLCHVDAARREHLSVPRRDPNDARRDAVPAGERRTLFVKQADESSADVPEADQDEIDGHFGLRIVDWGVSQITFGEAGAP